MNIFNFSFFKLKFLFNLNKFIQIFLLRINIGSGHTAAGWVPEEPRWLVLTDCCPHPTQGCTLPRTKKKYATCTTRQTGRWEASLDYLPYQMLRSSWKHTLLDTDLFGLANSDRERTRVFLAAARKGFFLQTGWRKCVCRCSFPSASTHRPTLGPLFQNFLVEF